MDEAIKGLIEELKKAVRFTELRKAPTTGEYLEAVFLREDLVRCCELLSTVFGPPIKEFGRPPTFTQETQKTVDVVGGIRANQCLYLAQKGARDVGYAALWPWESDPARLTLKVGTWQVQ